MMLVEVRSWGFSVAYIRVWEFGASNPRNWTPSKTDFKGLGFRVEGLGFGVWGLGFGV